MIVVDQIGRIVRMNAEDPYTVTGVIEDAPDNSHFTFSFVTSMDKRMKKQLVIDALVMAIGHRRPEPGLLHHSDRGSQYASKDYQKLLKKHGIIGSMSRKGDCWDKPTESFFSSLKKRGFITKRIGRAWRLVPISSTTLSAGTIRTGYIQRSDTRVRLNSKTKP